MKTLKELKQRAFGALNEMDDCARMDVGVDPVGARTTLEKIILEFEECCNKQAAQIEMMRTAIKAVEIDSDECMDFDECTAMLVPMDTYHQLNECLNRPGFGLNSRPYAHEGAADAMTLLTRLAAAEKDAARYRWLRDMPSQDWIHNNFNIYSKRNAALDAVIDDAMKGLK